MLKRSCKYQTEQNWTILKIGTTSAPWLAKYNHIYACIKDLKIFGAFSVKKNKNIGATSHVCHSGTHNNLAILPVSMKAAIYYRIFDEWWKHCLTRGRAIYKRNRSIDQSRPPPLLNPLSWGLPFFIFISDCISYINKHLFVIINIPHAITTPGDVKVNLGPFLYTTSKQKKAVGQRQQNKTSPRRRAHNFGVYFDSAFWCVKHVTFFSFAVVQCSMGE